MNIIQSNYVLLVGCLLSVPLAVRADEGPSTPRKNKRRCSLAVTPSPCKRQRVAPKAPFKERIDTSRLCDQKLADTVAEKLDTYSWVARHQKTAYALGKRILETDGHALKASDGRSMLYMFSQYPQFERLSRSIWDKLSAQEKHDEVVFQADSVRFRGETLLHHLVQSGSFELADAVSQIPQDLLRQNDDGKLACESYQDREKTLVGRQVERATTLQLYRHLQEVRAGITGNGIRI